MTAKRAGWALGLPVLVTASCTSLLGDGQYHVVQDAGTPADTGSSSGSSGGADSGSSGSADSGSDGDSSDDDADAGSSSGTDAEADDAGSCLSGTVGCYGTQPLQCDVAGTGWQGNGPACSGATPFCYLGTCTATPPSCAPGGEGMSDCGAAGESCCSSLGVTGGTYFRSYGSSGDGGAGDGGTASSDPATVSSFRLDKYEVTVARFRQFVSAVLPPIGGGMMQWFPSAGSGKHTHLNGGQGLANSGSPGTYEPGWNPVDDVNVSPTSNNMSCDASYATWTETASGQDKLPINCMTWQEAYAFCIWDGGFLPSETEFEYAAAGGAQQREYPWGSTAPGTTCPGTGCQYAIYGCYYPSGTGQCSGVTNIAPVGTLAAGAGVWGQLDLAGNAWEWELDWYNNYVDPCFDCASLTSGSGRTIRGGGFNYAASYLPPAGRYYGPKSRILSLGFRCARAP